jgi:hypothetical protein
MGVLMIEAIVEECLIELEQGCDWACEIDLSKYLESPAFKEAESELFAERQSVSASASFYQEMRFGRIEVYRDWEALLIAPISETKLISTSSVFAIVKAIRLPGEVYVDRHLVHNFPKPGDIPQRHSISLQHSRKINEGDVFLVRPGCITSTLRGNLTGSYFLRINGPVRHSSTLSFDKNSLEFKAVNFSDSSATAVHFMVTLIDKYLSECECRLVKHDHANRYRILDFLCQELSQPIHFFTKWKIVQIVARRQGSRVIDFLRSTANGDLPNAAVSAAKALIQISKSGAN